MKKVSVKNPIGPRAVTTLRLVILASIVSVAANGQAGGLFTASSKANDKSTTPESRSVQAQDALADISKRSRIVGVDFSQLDSVREALIRRGSTAEGPSGIDASEPVLLLNLFDDAQLKGIVERTAKTLSGYSLTGRIEGTEFSRVVLAVNRDAGEKDIVFGEVHTPAATYRIETNSGPLYKITEIDDSKSQPPDEPPIPSETASR